MLIGIRIGSNEQNGTKKLYGAHAHVPSASKLFSKRKYVRHLQITRIFRELIYENGESGHKM